MTVISDQAPPGQDHIMRRLADLERQVREMAAGRRLEAASVGAGGITIKGGSLRVLDEAGELVVQLGRLPDDTYGLAAIDPAGILVALSTLAFGLRGDVVEDNESTTSTTFDDLDTIGPVVPNVPIGASGRCLVIISAHLQENSSDIVRGGRMSVAITGATTRSANSMGGLRIGHTDDGQIAGGFSSNNLSMRSTAVELVDGLNPGQHTFTAKYLVNGSGVDDEVWFTARSVVVLPY